MIGLSRFLSSYLHLAGRILPYTSNLPQLYWMMSEPVPSPAQPDAPLVDQAGPALALHPIQRVPPEILAAILEHSIDSYLPGPWGSSRWAMVQYDSDDRTAWRAICRAPFKVSAVCKHWHTVSHSTPSLWRYIDAVLDSNLGSDSAERLAARIRLLMARAGSVLLYAVIYCSRYASADARGLWPLVNEVVARSGTLYLSCMNEDSFTQLADCLRQPVPRLTEFVLHTVRPDEDEQQPALVPFTAAPRLLRLHWAWNNVAWDAAGEEGFPALEDAVLSYPSLTAPGLLAWLARVPNARTLDVSASLLALGHPAPAPTTLAHLHTLVLKINGMDLAAAQSLRFPRIRHARIFCFLQDVAACPPETMGAFLSRALASVEQLKLVYPPAAVPTEALTALHSLRSIELGDDMLEIPLSPAFYDAFMPTADGAWPCPRLESLVVFHDSDETPKLVRLANARCFASAEVATMPVLPLRMLFHGPGHKVFDKPIMDDAIAVILAED